VNDVVQQDNGVFNELDLMVNRPSDNMSTTNNKLTPSTTENISAKNNISFEKNNQEIGGNAGANFNISDQQSDNVPRVTFDEKRKEEMKMRREKLKAKFDNELSRAKDIVESARAAQQ